jgi:hypothetical protein
MAAPLSLRAALERAPLVSGGGSSADAASRDVVVSRAKERTRATEPPSRSASCHPRPHASLSAPQDTPAARRAARSA